MIGALCLNRQIPPTGYTWAHTSLLLPRSEHLGSLPKGFRTHETDHRHQKREEVVHVPKVVTHTRTSHQHVEQTVEAGADRPDSVMSGAPQMIGANERSQEGYKIARTEY